METFDGIIDVYDENHLDFAEAQAQGIRVILHETSQGLFKIDTAYQARKKTALDLGFLWLGYHLLSAEDTEAQLEQLLSIESGEDPRVGLAVDWERSSQGLMAHSEVIRFVQLFNERMKPRYSDRYPILYGGSVLRETEAIRKGDLVLSKCPLWYVRYTKGDLGIPESTWKTYTLWQFDDEKRQWGGPRTNILPGADFNRYQGTFDALSSVWPFADDRR